MDRNNEIVVRNPHSTRPFQHVLEPLSVYLTVAKEQYENGAKAGNYNVGPEEADCVTVGELATLFCDAWQEGVCWKNVSDEGPHEAAFLKLDCSKIKRTLGWKPRWNIRTAVEKTVEWSRIYRDQSDVRACMEAQIREFMEL